MIIIEINGQRGCFNSLHTGKSDRKMRKRARDFILKNGGTEDDLKKYGVDIQQNVTRYNTHNF